MTKVSKDEAVTNDDQATVAAYISKITSAWNRSRAAIFECGDYLRQAKQDLPHGEYQKMVNEDLPFGTSTAAKLVKIAEYRPFQQEGVMEQLPVSWGTLGELERFDAAKFMACINEGKIKPDMTRRDVDNLRREKHASTMAKSYDGHEAFEKPENCDVGDLTKLGEAKRTFSVIYADPPWSYYANDNGKNVAPYPTMSDAEIKKLPVKEVVAAENAHLFLWVTSPLLDKGIEVLREWGFYYKASYVWVKPNRAIALGSYWNNSHEILLLGVRGRHIAFREKVDSHLIMDADPDHSRKPDDVRDMVDKVGLAGPRIELFARRTYDGWVSWGNEINRDDFGLALENTVEQSKVNAHDASPIQQADCQYIDDKATVASPPANDEMALDTEQGDAA
jgi:N6-adenosine-specific RNA methylase IME4